MDEMYFYDTLPSSGSLSLEEMIENDIKMERVSASDDDEPSTSPPPPLFDFFTGNGHNNNYHHYGNNNNNHHQHYRPSSGFSDSFSLGLHDDADYRLDFDGGGLLVNPCTGLPSGLDSDSLGDYPQLVIVKPPAKITERVNPKNINNNVVKKKSPVIKQSRPICDRSRPSFHPCGDRSSDSEESSDVDDDDDDDDIDVSMNVSMKMLKPRSRLPWVDGVGERRLLDVPRRCQRGRKIINVGPQNQQKRLAAENGVRAVALSSPHQRLQEIDDEDDYVDHCIDKLRKPVAAAVATDLRQHPHRIFPKPAFSYSCLIALALKNSATGCLPVSEIYSYMIDTFPYFKTAPNGWKNSVRHNLSLNKCFEKVESDAPINGSNQRKGCLWAVNPEKALKMDDEVLKWSRKNPSSIINSMARPENFQLLGTGFLKKDDKSTTNLSRTGVKATVQEPWKAVSIETRAVNRIIQSELEILVNDGDENDDDDDDGDENDDNDNVDEDDDDDGDVDVDSASGSDSESFGNPELWKELVDKMEFELPINEYLISPGRRRDQSVATDVKLTMSPTPLPSVVVNVNGTKSSSTRMPVPAAKRFALSRERVS